MSFKIDIHVHTKRRSRCAKSSAGKMCVAARKYGMDAICFTEHHTYVEPTRLVGLQATFPNLWLISGIEITVAGKEDIIVLGVTHPELKRGMSYKKLHRIVRDHNGFMSLAHPFRKHDPIDELLEYPPDTIEIQSRNICTGNMEKIREFAEQVGVPVINASDAHRDRHVGLYHVELACRPVSIQDLFTQLRRGVYTRCSDQQRLGS